VRAERLADGLQLGSQLAEVVDLAVVRDPEAAVGGSHRHRAGRRGVDDRQAAVYEPYRAVGVQALAVRAAVGDDLAHALQHVLVGRAAGALEHPGDAAHASVS
jgi:hypothetical protein